PIVGVPACRKFIEPHPFHAVGEKYIAAVTGAADALPIMIPALGEALDRQRLLEMVDGLMFTGSPSNVAPRHYGGALAQADIELDPHRDATTLPLIRAAVSQVVPVLAVCRGFQEMNVAYGGTLHQLVHEVQGKLDHREDKAKPLEEQYGPAHEVRLRPGGALAAIAGTDTIEVNSLHGQAVHRLGAGLRVEATAPDGIVEAFSVEGAPSFALAVQWHPEYRVLENAVSRALFARFGEACRARASARSSGAPPQASHTSTRDSLQAGAVAE
ncbi:MAG: gamma-glutamyl-gamma-aminobutyrate hydrolase family protein, partial [Gammaproteobacteria bacterium]